MTADQAPADADTPHFSALLTPHRSLGRNGFVALMLATAALCIVPAMTFLAMGAWPIAGFLGLDILALYVAFRLNYRAARAREEVSVSRTRLLVRKIAPSGGIAEHLFNPFWAKLDIARHPEIGVTRLDVRGEGRSVSVGSFLNPADRESFALAFQGALAKARR
jgi:uncharacterized membrane protein